VTAPIVLALDGSEHAARAARWCAAHAKAIGADVLVVHAVDNFYDFGSGAPIPLVPPTLSGPQLDELRDVIEREWSKPLADAGVAYLVRVAQGRAASVVIDAVRDVHAELVVCGRRGRGGVAEFFLGSTSHELAHHAGVPIVIVP
jgi:nucleotide-binding universal stress UspA family protein